MGTIAQKIARALDTKEGLKDTINTYLGQDITDAIPFKDYETYIKNFYNAAPKTEFEEGSDIRLENTLKGKLDFEDDIVGIGDISQKSYQGYNLCEAKMPTTTATQGITFTNNGDGTYTISGTNSSEAAVTFRINQSTQIGGDNLQNYEDGTYTLDLGIANANMQLTLMQDVSWTSYIATGYGIRLRSQAITNVTNTFIYVGIKGNASFDTPVTIKPMLVKGSYTESTIPSFEPYVGETASPNSSYTQEVKVVRGKNLLNLDWFENNHSLGSDGLPNAFNGRVANTTPIDVTYYNSITLSYKNNSIMFIYSLFDKNNSFIRRVASNTSGTTINTINASKLYISFYDSVSISKENINDPQLEQGTKATSYLPYNTIGVKARGKNKLDFSEWLNTLMDKNPNITAGSIDRYTDNSITITSNGNDCFTASYTISNNAATNKSFCETYPSLVQEVKGNTKYTISYNRSNTSLIARSCFFYLDENYNYLGLDEDRTAADNATFTTPSNAKYLTFRFGLYGSTGSTLTISNLMIEESPSATNYEPYYNPQIKQLFLGNFKPSKIGNYKDYFYRTNGKNLFDNSVERKNAYIGASASDIGTAITYYNSSATYSYVNCAYVEAGKTYTLSWKQSTTPASTNNRIGAIVDNNNIVLAVQQTWINTATQITFTPSVSGYLVLCTDINAINIQLELGNTATDYNPYGSGDWYFKAKNGYTMLKSTLGWIQAPSSVAEGTTRFYCNKSDVANLQATQSKDILSNAFIPLTWNEIYLGDTTTKNAISDYSQENSVANRIVIRIDSNYASSVNELNTFLDNNDFYAYYLKAIPTDTKITDTTMISQLEEIYNLMSYTGTTILEVDGDLPMIIKCRALKGE